MDTYIYAERQVTDNSDTTLTTRRFHFYTRLVLIYYRDRGQSPKGRRETDSTFSPYVPAERIHWQRSGHFRASSTTCGLTGSVIESPTIVSQRCTSRPIGPKRGIVIPSKWKEKLVRFGVPSYAKHFSSCTIIQKVSVLLDVAVCGAVMSTLFPAVSIRE